MSETQNNNTHLKTGKRKLLFMMYCVICQSSDIKYKCPRCFVRYCSLICYKSHKEVCPKETTGEDPKVNSSSESRPPPGFFEAENEDKVAPQTLAKLGESQELKLMLHNPHLQRLLNNLDTTETPSLAMETAMQEPIFTDFVDICLRIVEPQPNVPCG